MPTSLHRRVTQLTDTLHRHEAAAAAAEPPPPPVPPGVELFRPWSGAPLERRASADEWNAHQHLAAERRRAWRTQNPGQPLPPELFQAPPFALDPAQCPCRLFPPGAAAAAPPPAPSAVPTLPANPSPTSNQQRATSNCKAAAPPLRPSH